MKPQRSRRITALFLGIVILVQSFGFVPVFAAGTSFTYILNYEEEAYISQEHPIIIPDSDIDPEYGAEAHYPFNSGSEGISSVTGNAISDWGPDPYRIVGYTFMGWYTERDGEGTKVDENTIITDDMLGAFNILNLYGHWEEYNSPDITTDSLVISAKNEQKENLDDVTLTHSQGSATGFVNDVTEYYAEVFGDTHYLTLDFEQYEPTAVTSVKFNGADVALDSNKKEILTTTAYSFDDNANLIGRTVNSGINLGTVEDSIVLDMTSDAQEYNVIEITVKLPETSPVSERTYTINIKRLKMELNLNYGNTPYGRIMKNDILTDEEKNTARADFDSTLVYRNNTYSASAWNPYGSDGIEVVKGTVLSGKQYINYDKDDTAIVVYSGDSFVDPGVTLYNDKGEEVVLSDSDYITRTITYETVSSLKHENWSSVTPATDVSKLTGDDSDLANDILKENEVKPGVYTINYSYTSGDTTVSADRNMIVLPKLGDVNMDNYVNALDTAVYDMEIGADSISNCLYMYRALDVNNDGSINDTDKEYLKAGTTIKALYTSLSESEEAVQSAYTVTEADSAKAQMYMDYLGTDSSDLTGSADATQQLEQGDVFWVGYRFANSSAISSDTEIVTLAVNYDSRYIAPDADDLSALITVINENNPDLAVFNIEGGSDIDAKYTCDSSTAQCTWQDMTSVNTLLLEMYLKDGESFTLQDGYFIKLPFEVKVVPPSDGRKVISTQLGANTLNMIDASDDYGLMWDTSNLLNSVTENLMSKMQYMGDYVPVFGEEAQATLLLTTTYGATVNRVNSKFNKGTLDGGNLPEGLTYSSNLNKISGVPEETGTFEFYIDGIKYSIVVNKAELKVSADNKTKTYGDANPTLTYTYDESCLKNSDTVAEAVQTQPTITCEATEKTPYESVVPITLSGGASDNYYFTFTDGTLTVDKQRELNITAISKIPVCTAQIISDNGGAFPITITTTAQNTDGFTASEIVAGDNIMISYGVVYNSGTVGKQTVNIADAVIVTDEDGFEAGKNYTIKTCVSSSTEGEVANEVITTIRMRSQPTLAYEYGTPLDLDGGELQITYDSGKTVNVTLQEAKDLGIRIRHSYDNSVANTGDEITVKEHDGEHLIIDYPSSDSVPVLNTSKISVTKKDLHVTADDKSRYYGDANDTVTFTHSFTESDFVYGDTKDTIGFVAPTFSCDATASTEVDKTLGYSEAVIVITGGSSDNYNIVCVDGTLTINKRPLNITAITAGVPALTAKDYFGKTAPFKVGASAVAGDLSDGEEASMTVTNLYNNDPVKVNYNAQYASNTPAESVAVAVVDCVMDDDYGKSYNYTVGTATASADGGRVYERKIKSLKIVEQPTVDYVYGTPLDLETGEIEIIYDSGETYNVTFEEAKAHPVNMTYTGTQEEPLNGEKHTVADSGRTITVTPDTIYDVDAVITNEITIEKHKLHVSADDIYTTYGDIIPAYTYTYRDGDLQYGETEETALSETPVIVCKEDDGLTEVNQKTFAGVYTLKISGGEADNYELVHINGNCTVRQRPLVVTTVNDIPSLSAKDAFDKNLSVDVTVETDKSESTLVFSAGNELLWDDKVRISYTVTYPDTTEEGEKNVTISNAVLDRTYGDCRNYYLQNIVSPQKGEIEKAVISNIEITADPTDNADGTTYEYSYGDSLDLSNGKLKITFDSGRVDENVTFDSLADYGIVATYTGTEDVVTDGVFVTISYHNNKSITFTPPSDSTASAVETDTFVVNKRKMHVIVNDSTSVYGDEIEYTLDYNEDDLAEGETLLTAFTAPFFAPVLSCEIDGTEAGVTTPAGVYTDAIKASGGSTANYEFICDDTGTLTINKRPIKIWSINSGIPDLTSAIAYENNYTLPIKLNGTADNSNLTLENIVNNDQIQVTYEAVYNSLEQSDAEPVTIENLDFDSDCTAKDNYTISQWPTDATGRVLTRLVSKITVKSDLSKMEYTYGEWFRLEGGSVDIEYNSGYVEQNVTFDNLADYGINITFVTENEQGDEVLGEEVKNNTLLTVPVHNGAKIKLTVADPARAVADISPAYSGEITVNKKKMEVIAGDATITYGDNAPEYTFSYDQTDLVNGDSFTSARFTDGFEESTVSCTVDGNAVNSQTFAGEYDIVPTAGKADNYEFVPVNGTLTIKKKEIKIKSIDSSVPHLTSDILYNNGGKPPVKVSGKAVYTSSEQSMTVEGVINNDEIGIVYNAVYNDIVASDWVTVDIADVEFDTVYPRNDCYTIIETPLTATGGSVVEAEIKSVSIVKDPLLRDDNNQSIQYTYGNTLNLERGAVRVEYDSGLVLEDVKFSDIESATDGAVTLVYVDNGTEMSEVPTNGEVLYASYHNGKAIKLKVSSLLTVTEPQTSEMVVNKAEITVTAKNKERYYGDSNPELEFEYSGFVNGDDETSDNFRLELEEPEISCGAHIKSPVGEYDIELSGGSSANYRFTLVPATLTVNKRLLDVTAITGGIPALTSKMIHDDSQVVHKLNGVAINTAGQFASDDLSDKDTVRLTYTVTYTSITPASNIIVSISDISLDTEYGHGSNYELGSVPSTALGGNILDKQISMVEITTQPKLEYVYGEALDLTGRGVRITFDNGEVLSDVAFNELSQYGISLTLTDAEGNTTPAFDGDKLTVNKHTGAYLTLIPSTILTNVDTAVSKTITVKKKNVDVNVKSVSSVYGDDPTAGFAFEYDSSDLVYGETIDSAEFTDSLVEPVFLCKEKDGSTLVSSKTNVGSYTISMQNGSHDNYAFVYKNGMLVITRRPVIITDITDGIPPLTSDIIFASPGTAHKLGAEAVNNQLVVENIVNNDKIRIRYNAVYWTENPSDNCMIELEYISVDDTYEQSRNYQIDTANSVKSVDGGVVFDREITAVEIIEQPKLEYTYGDKLDLSAGSVKVTYDSGYVVENVTFDNLADLGITVSYSDENNSMRTAANGDVLTVPDHNGKVLALTAKSTHTVEVVKTDELTVNKLVLEYGDCVVDTITYDGSTVATTGMIVFTNPQNGDKVTATAVFNFDDCNAGEEKTVYITDITLDDVFTANYELPSDNVISKGNIEKATETVSLTADAVAVSNTTNSITITPPEMTQVQKDGGAEYEYSIDGGATWQKSNVFENLSLGQDCKICIRFAETDNYKQSEATTPIELKTYINKITLISYTDANTLVSFYTNTESVKNSDELEKLIADIGIDYYGFYSDERGKIKIKFPLEFTGDMVFYTSLKRQSSGGGSKGSKSTPTPKPTIEPTPTPVPEVTPSPSPTETPAVAVKNEPYISGYLDMVRPDSYMTRAEAATIMVKIAGDTGLEYENIFPDVRPDTWYKNVIAQANAREFVSGFDDGLFRPEDIVTREQFTSMVARLINLEPENSEAFSDVAIGRWSAGHISAALNAGIVTGYADGTFLPENPITRAEAMRMVNVAINRIPDKEAIDKVECPYSDLPKTHWAYYEVMVASCDF